MIDSVVQVTVEDATLKACGHKVGTSSTEV